MWPCESPFTDLPRSFVACRVLPLFLLIPLQSVSAPRTVRADACPFWHKPFPRLTRAESSAQGNPRVFSFAFSSTLSVPLGKFPFSFVSYFLLSILQSISLVFPAAIHVTHPPLPIFLIFICIVLY